MLTAVAWRGWSSLFERDCVQTFIHTTISFALHSATIYQSMNFNARLPHQRAVNILSLPLSEIIQPRTMGRQRREDLRLHYVQASDEQSKGMKSQAVACKYCGKVLAGTTTRMECHLKACSAFKELRKRNPEVEAAFKAVLNSKAWKASATGRMSIGRGRGGKKRPATGGCETDMGRGRGRGDGRGRGAAAGAAGAAGVVVNGFKSPATKGEFVYIYLARFDPFMTPPLFPIV
jgi:hypothetical protein